MCPRELHQVTQNAIGADSPFHPSHAQSEEFTDITIYASSSDPLSEGPQLKKRKRDANGTDIIINTPFSPVANDAQFARFPSRMLANKHMSQHVHQFVKRESEQFAAMVVRDEGI